MDFSDTEDDDNLSSDSDDNESSSDGLDSAEEVVTTSDSDSNVDESERMETDVETEGSKDFSQFLDNLVEVVRDDLDKVDDVNEPKPKLMWEVWEDEIEKWIDQHITEGVSLDNLNETVDPSPDFVMPLLRYQKEWLARGLKQEESSSRGGILADEMGMGKTVHAIALVVTKRALSRELGEPAALAPSCTTGLPCVKTTLVICPLIGVMQWVNEIDRFTAKGSNKVLAYHGPNRGKTLLEFAGYDFVITAYSIVEGEYQKHSKEDLFFLHSIKWTRVILDEAHYIKDRRSSTAQAVFALESSYRWALIDTAFENDVGELTLHTLGIRHVRVALTDYIDTSNIAIPFAHNDGSGRVRATILLRHKVLKCILLRRTRKDRATDLALPPITFSLRCDYLDIKEEDYYTSLKRESDEHIDRYDEEGTVMSNYGHVFNLRTRLRQAADHPYLVVYSKSESNDEQLCGLCHDVAEDPVVTSCEHLFCKLCLMDFSDNFLRIACPCPSCSEPVTFDSSVNNHNQEIQDPNSSLKGFKSSSILNRIPLENFKTGTKIDALKEEIRFMMERDGSAKGIVFSEFTSFLDLIHYSLQKIGVKCVQLDGFMTMAAREAAVTRFTNEEDCNILLMSLKAGGDDLNLTIASHVFLMEPWRNPAVERQAQDRIYRIGQQKPVRVVKFVIEDTIEKDIMRQQETRKSCGQ